MRSGSGIPVVAWRVQRTRVILAAY